MRVGGLWPVAGRSWSNVKARGKPFQKEVKRKNALFAGSDQGGEHWAILASLIQTAKLNDIDPQAWLADVITRIVQGHPPESDRRTHALESCGPAWHIGGMTKAESPSDDPSQIATLRIELQDTDPLIWRQVEVSTSSTLKDLHAVIQAAMGWQNQHMWEFRIGRQVYAQPIAGGAWGGTTVVNAGKVELRELLKPRKTAIDYTYDMGDCWEHRLIITDPRPADPAVSYPRYIAGERPAPPEDCGGVPGFYANLEVLADPSHPEHEDVADWFDGYDPDHINEVALKLAVGRIASRRKTAKTRKPTPPKT